LISATLVLKATKWDIGNFGFGDLEILLDLAPMLATKITMHVSASFNLHSKI